MGRENHDPSFEITLSVDNNSNTIKVLKFDILDQSSLHVPIDELITVVEQVFKNRKDRKETQPISKLILGNGELLN